jgi:hypothetical protein
MSRSAGTRRRVHYRRTFLNSPGHHAGAYVIASIERGTAENGRAWVDADLTVADCSTVTTLDFWVADDATPATRRNALHKARVLREVVTAFVAELERALEDPRA